MTYVILAVAAVLVVLPPSWDPAIKWKDRHYKLPWRR